MLNGVHTSSADRNGGHEENPVLDYHVIGDNGVSNQDHYSTMSPVNMATSLQCRKLKCSFYQVVRTVLFRLLDHSIDSDWNNIAQSTIGEMQQAKQESNFCCCKANKITPVERNGTITAIHTSDCGEAIIAYYSANMEGVSFDCGL